jgi:uncharacterized membrane protein
VAANQRRADRGLGAGALSNPVSRPIKLENAMKLPFIRAGDSHPRSIAKTLSWRITGSVDTFVLGLIFTGNAKIAGSIAVAEMATKMVLYYIHERAWSAIRWNQ